MPKRLPVVACCGYDQARYDCMDVKTCEVHLPTSGSKLLRREDLFRPRHRPAGGTACRIVWNLFFRMILLACRSNEMHKKLLGLALDMLEKRQGKDGDAAQRIDRIMRIQENGWKWNEQIIEFQHFSYVEICLQWLQVSPVQKSC